MDVNTKEISKTKKLDSLNFLRGVAVLMVCFCHFGGALRGDHIFSGLFDIFHRYGGYGVEVFFVISGFIIPYSLMKGKYRLGDYFRFLYKRLLRLHPPYLAALALTLLITYFSFRTRNASFPESTTSIVRSMFYLQSLRNNPVFWTLRVEVQYYFFIGIFYLLLKRYSNIALFVVLPCLLLLSHTPVIKYISLFKFIVYFLMGILAFLIYADQKNNLRNWLLLGGLFLFAFIFYSKAGFLLATAATFFILFYKKSIPSFLQFPGTISYSIYLVHFPLGIKLINFLKPKLSPGNYYLLFVLTLAVVIISSWIFYKIFEEFSESLSKKVRYSGALTVRKELSPVS